MIETDKLQDIEDVVITSNKGVPIKVGQIAKVIVGNRPEAGQGRPPDQGRVRRRQASSRAATTTTWSRGSS